MLEDDGKPEDYVDEIATIVKAEPAADYKRVHTELQRLYRVAISHKRLRTYLGALDRSAITGGSTATSSDSIARRRSPKVAMEQGSDWLYVNEDRVYELLSTLGVCGWDKLQQSIQQHCGITIGHQPLQTFLDRAYGKGGKLASVAVSYTHLRAHET